MVPGGVLEGNVDLAVLAGVVDRDVGADGGGEVPAEVWKALASGNDSMDARRLTDGKDRAVCEVDVKGALGAAGAAVLDVGDLEGWG